MSGGVTGPRIGKSAHRCKSAPWFPHESVPAVILMAIYRLGSPWPEPCPACVTCPCLEVCGFCWTEVFCVNTLDCSLAVQLQLCRAELIPRKTQRDQKFSVANCDPRCPVKVRYLNQNSKQATV
ncbi:hypothetical protein MPTK1_8g13340 [Marchantia polymorpha subsp. ruderalis]|uniref:Uncharacterized protein n=1 Tax=Marchantia polymorpha TaxID=3197 RepID=A0A2R6WCE1_MARPO|nr:hypothetical protein MARPO_0110s0015 [Marchantia polymorpha]BBN19755.1 hypothetical protein Mp_8g13340 [Marchantia polymorpha subsp. ruderalis]|eukprot:PTQ31522.1 hypothetical protein MARPO_0110s0015 [Marchantia polymorpha]